MNNQEAWLDLSALSWHLTMNIWHEPMNQNKYEPNTAGITAIGK